MNSRKFCIRINYTMLALVAFYCFDLMHLIFMQVLSYSSARIVSTIILWALLLLAASKRKTTIKKDAVVLLALNWILFMFSCLVYPEYRYAIFEMPTWNFYTSVFTFSSGMFAYLFFRMEEDPKKILKYLKTMAYLLFVWALLRIRSAIAQGGFTRIFENGIASSNSYDMSVGYRLLFVCIVFLINAIKEQTPMRKAYYYTIAAVSATLMAVFGSRTALVSLILFWCLYSLLIQYKGQSVREFGRRVVFILALILSFAILTNKSVLNFLVGILNKFGVNSRMLDSLISGGIELDNGRMRLWTMVYGMIIEHPLFGAGIYADRAIGGIYCHQIVLEILLDFGFLMGGLIILGIIYWIVIMLFRCKDQDWKLLFIVFFSLCFIRLNVSSSFWYDTNFWICIAIAVNYKRSRNWQR